MTTGTMYDSTDPAEIPPGAQVAALYRNGRFAATPAQARRFPVVLWIDVLGTAPESCSILDIETGDATPDTVLSWVPARLGSHTGAHCRLYCNLSTWPAVRQAVASITGITADERASIMYWIANPTGTPHLVPGSDATQYLFGLGFDESAFLPGWLAGHE